MSESTVSPAAPPLLDAQVVAGFSVRLDGLDLGMWTEVSLGGITVAVEPHKEGGLSSVAHQLRGQFQYEPIKLSRIVTGGALSIGAWFRAQTTDLRRMSGEIVVYTTSGLPIQRWNFIDAIPVRWSIPPMRSGDHTAIVETLELAHQGFVD